MVYALNNVLFPIDFFIKLTLRCNTNVGKCTDISRYLVKSIQYALVLYSTVWRRLMVFCYGMNFLTVTKTVHITTFQIQQLKI